MFWDCNHFVGNVGINNIFERTRYLVVLQNNHLVDNTKRDKTYKGHKVRLIDHLNELQYLNFKQYFQTSLKNVLMNTWQNSNDVPVSCPNIMKFYNNGKDGVDVIDQKTAAYRLDRESKHRFYLSMFLDLMNNTHVNSHMVYRKLRDDISLLKFKIFVGKPLIGRYSNSNRSFSTTRPSKRKYHEPSMTRQV